MKDPARHATKSCGDMTTQQTAREETRPAGVSLLRRGAVGVRGEHGSGLAGGGLGGGLRRFLARRTFSGPQLGENVRALKKNVARYSAPLPVGDTLHAALLLVVAQQLTHRSRPAK